MNRDQADVAESQESHDSPSLALAAWGQILRGTADQVARFLMERPKRATRLRQSSPFTDILSEPERLAIYESHSTRIYHPARQ